jgi:uridylate kinase
MLKIGGESLLGNRESGIDPKAVLIMAEKIKIIAEKKIEIVIVIGGGNIFRGLAASKNGIDRATADYMEC